MSELEFGSVASSALQLLAEAVEQETTRRGASERQSESMHAGLVASWLEQFAGAPLWERRKELGLQLRAELMELLGGMEPQLATALLCVLPGAERRGYTAERLAVSLGVAVGQIAAWESEAYTRLGELVSERTPLLAFLQGQAGEGHAEVPVPAATKEPADLQDSFDQLVKMARADVSFDLRKYVGAALELRIRQAFHRLGADESAQVESLFSEQERVVVALVGARMTLEIGGEEEHADG